MVANCTFRAALTCHFELSIREYFANFGDFAATKTARLVASPLRISAFSLSTNRTPFIHYNSKNYAYESGAADRSGLA